MAMYGYQQPLMDHPRLAELDGRDYSSVWDPRNSSAFTPLAATATNTNSSPAEANKTSAYDSFKTNGQDMKSATPGSGLNISLSQIRNYSSEKPANSESIKQDQ
jgi:hypothetical protein